LRGSQHTGPQSTLAQKLQSGGKLRIVNVASPCQGFTALVSPSMCCHHLPAQHEGVIVSGDEQWKFGCCNLPVHFEEQSTIMAPFSKCPEANALKSGACQNLKVSLLRADLAKSPKWC